MIIRPDYWYYAHLESQTEACEMPPFVTVSLDRGQVMLTMVDAGITLRRDGAKRTAGNQRAPQYDNFTHTDLPRKEISDGFRIKGISWLE